MLFENFGFYSFFGLFLQDFREGFSEDKKEFEKFFVLSSHSD